MSRKKYSTEKIISILREAELLSNQGKSIKEISRKLGITEQLMCWTKCPNLFRGMPNDIFMRFILLLQKRRLYRLLIGL
jgi:hypothetical protein